MVLQRKGTIYLSSMGKVRWNDGVGGTVKNVVSWDGKSSKCIITSPKDFAEYANATEWHQSRLYICLKVSYWKNKKCTKDTTDTTNT